MASIEKRGPGSWRVVLSCGYGPDGKKKRIQRNITVDPNKSDLAQRREVQKQAALLEADYERKQINDAKKMSFKDVYEGYVEDRLVRRGLAKQTIDSYKKLFVGRLLPAFGNRAIREITAIDLNVFFRKLSTESPGSKKSKQKAGCKNSAKKPLKIVAKKEAENKEPEKEVKEKLSGTYIRKYYQQLNEMFCYAQRSGIIVTNPCTMIEPPKIDTVEAQYYDVTECPAILQAIMNYSDVEWRCYFALSFFCGTRPEELTGLNWSDCEEDSIYIQAGAYQAKGEKCMRTERPKTKKSIRKIDLPPEAVKALSSWRKEQSRQRLIAGSAWIDPQAVFTNPLGERISLRQPSKRWKKFTKENNIRHLPLYDLRHTNCSLLISSRELSVEEVAARMGHEQTSTTLNIYSHAFRDSNARATKALMNVLKNAE